MNTAYIPTPIDESTRLEGTAATQLAAEVLITKTATFAGTGFDLGTPPANMGIGQPLAAVAKITAAFRGSSDETYTFQLMDSPDNSAWSAIGPTVESHVVGKISVPGFRTQRYVALAVIIAGTTPSLTYEAWLTVQGFPKT